MQDKQLASLISTGGGTHLFRRFGGRGQLSDGKSEGWNGSGSMTSGRSSSWKGSSSIATQSLSFRRQKQKQSKSQSLINTNSPLVMQVYYNNGRCIPCED